MSTVLALNHLSVALKRGRGRPIAVLDDVNLTVNAGEMTALVGESGSGKTIASLGIIRLLPRSAEISGQVMLAGTDLTGLSETEMRRVRGRDIGMVFQNPLSALNPTTRVGNQIAEVYRLHTGETDRAARARALDLLGEVGIPDPADRLDDYPHQFSGGMRQRVMIAASIACDPALIFCDEPTTALDVTVQAQILDLFKALQQDLQAGFLYVTHDLSVVAAFCGSLSVMYAGRIVEQSDDLRAMIAAPAHPYTRALLAAAPRIKGPIQRLQGIAASAPPLTERVRSPAPPLVEVRPGWQVAATGDDEIERFSSGRQA
jgi:ABC-type dipeptide/oligopeptide/nickel transport system ATPase component